VYHTIKKGQTLYRIAKTYGVSVNELVRANRIKDVTNIPVGTRIFIPGAKRPLPVPIYQPPLDLKKRPEFIWPLKGKVISNFGPRGNGFHKGIDIKSKPGTLICASANGKVVFSGWMRGYGNVVILEHEGDFYTIYAHNTKNLVLEGAFIQRGQGIALVGSTGRATCPHLHFEIRIGNKAKDPLHYLPVRP
jgi:murein DD-endopeptidase MepM/ murein hydrolase activator NlpD